MAGNPTDFNDMAVSAGRDALALFIRGQVTAIREDKPQGDAEAQPVRGYDPQEDYAPPKLPDDADRWQDLLELNQNRDPKASVRNLALVLTYDEQWRGVIGFDEFSNRVVKRAQPPLPNSEPGEWGDFDDASMRVWCSTHFGFTPNQQDIRDATLVVAKNNNFHPVRDYLRSLQWDGVPRLKTWLKRAFSSSDAERYLEVIGPKMLVGAVARVMRPGCKMDNVTILEGNQGYGKSTVIKILFGQWFSEAPIQIGDKDAYQIIQGVWALEVAELDAFGKAEVTALKQFFSTMTDRFRPSYGRVAMDCPRQTVFWGTTNQDYYLRDYTGNRRFWPVYCATVDKVWVTAQRDQLWAEAVHLFDHGYQWWVAEDNEETAGDFALVVEAQDSRTQRDPWEEPLAAYLRASASQYHSTYELLTDALKFDAAHIQQAHQNRIGPILKSLGYKNERKRFATPSGKVEQRRVWVHVDEAKKLLEVPL